ncbi:histidine kinase dimerization/phospho-acceptor domain-containing protein [Pleionea litopenaei]|uniref:histidine kinase n=1 Tax=Pleionea litopenaei TaxID=3070815 RepID=A0AA51RTC5_9GAMM|nr:histidine kinase dimerization/phospho-acceptor domain-containing protein [Pleionea sp. HL-JVS1]WMS87225.1 histidine kinase dimerization/phospho-acceptor domain-containing protein [Pleionea sp. HL-JVS1]
MEKLKTRFWNLRRKLYLFSITLLIIPFFSVTFLKQLEAVFTENMLRGLEKYTSAIAFAVQSSVPQSFDAKNTKLTSLSSSEPPLYVATIDRTILVDGFSDDWSSLRGFELAPVDDGLTVSAASDQKYLYLLIEVSDSKVVYREYVDLYQFSDSLEVTLENAAQDRVNLLFAPVAVGKVNPLVQSNTANGFWVSSAFWQQTPDGYALEIKIPFANNWQRLGVKVQNFTNEQRVVETKKSYHEHLNPMQWPSVELVSALAQLDVGSGQRVWVLDQQGNVKARRGNLETELPMARVNPLIHFLLSPPLSDFTDPRARTISWQHPLVNKALQGVTGSDLEAFEQSSTAIAMVATPLWRDDKVVGTIIVEETVAAVQLMQQEALNVFINTVFVVLFVVIIMLIILASRFTQRIMRLNRQASLAVDRFGRVREKITPEFTADEIGDLSQSFASMTQRLSDYHEYLEKLASRLSHELRTPIAVIRSSVDTIAMSDDESIQPAVKHAQDGVQRLSQMITRMREAARMEQSVLQVALVPLSIDKFLKDYLSAVQGVFEDHPLKLELSGEPFKVLAAEELIAQLMDKLLSNAKDFAVSGTPIEVKLNFQRNELLLGVFNQGEPLPDLSERELFSSMVSQRSQEHRDHTQTHMGLGLYLVRLIAEHCQGRYFARNWSGDLSAWSALASQDDKKVVTESALTRDELKSSICGVVIGVSLNRY